MFEPGFVLNNRYEIKTRLQESNDLYDYYQAVDRNNNCDVIIKALNKSFSWDTGIVSRFKTVAREMCTVKSRYILNVTDWGSSDDTYYMVLENIKGISLKRYIEKKNQISSKEAISILVQACYGLQEAHDKHIIHGELTSENILIDVEGVIKVTGFCIPRSLKYDRIKYYFPPEITEENPADVRSDIYILGIILYEMLTKHTPYDGASAAEIIEKHKTQPFPSLRAERRDVPPYVKIIVYKCCEKSPDSRYQSVKELIDTLKSALMKIVEEEKGVSKAETDEKKSTDTAGSNVSVNTSNNTAKSTVTYSKPSEDYTRIRSVIKKAIELLTADILLDKRLFITVIEDLAPELVSEKEFLTGIYSDDVGRLLHSAYTAGNRNDHSEVDSFLENHGFNDNWKQRFLGFFSFVFPDAGELHNDRLETHVVHINQDKSAAAITPETNTNVSGSSDTTYTDYVETMKKVRNMLVSAHKSWAPSGNEPESKQSGNQDQGFDFSFGDDPAKKTENPSVKTSADVKPIPVNNNDDVVFFKAEMEKVLRSSILNKNNHLYSITGELPKEVKKLWKNQWKYSSNGKEIKDQHHKEISQKKGKFDEKKILLALTVENTFGVQEGIVVTAKAMVCITKSRATTIEFDRIKDVKTYIQGAGLAIKVMLDDDSIIATDINSEKYDIKPIVAYLESIKRGG